MTTRRPNITVVPCKYKVGKTLGTGTYAVVKECVHTDTRRYYAAKIINKKLMHGREHMIRNEIAVLKRISQGHRHILTLVDFFETANNLYLITDLAFGGELFDRICKKGSYYESDAMEIVKTTLAAVCYLHDNGIVHRDLKPENLLFRSPAEDSDLLLADFGLSRIIDEEQMHVLMTTCGTPGYMAPEIFNKTGHGKPVDVWALGVITYFLLCGYTPFDRDTSVEEMKAIMAGDYSFEPEEYWEDISEAAKDFIRACLTVDPKERMSSKEAQSHPFLHQQFPPDQGVDLLPKVRDNFNARRTLVAAIHAIQAMNKMKNGGAMDGAMTTSPVPAKAIVLNADFPLDPLWGVEGAEDDEPVSVRRPSNFANAALSSHPPQSQAPQSQPHSTGGGGGGGGNFRSATSGKINGTRDSINSIGGGINAGTLAPPNSTIDTAKDHASTASSHSVGSNSLAPQHPSSSSHSSNSGTAAASGSSGLWTKPTTNSTSARGPSTHV
ncbi:Calcium/calmodulin-dependent protein kinase type I [Savitreella phatthalungensis]